MFSNDKGKYDCQYIIISKILQCNKNGVGVCCAYTDFTFKLSVCYMEYDDRCLVDISWTRNGYNCFNTGLCIMIFVHLNPVKLL